MRITTMETIIMVDDTFTRALLAGIGIAVIAGPLGCFVIWRRMAYFGDTMAHSALLGAALSLYFDLNIMITVFVIAISVALLLRLFERRKSLSTDAILGILAHSTLALGLVMVAAMTWADIDLESLLFGDILSVTNLDLAIILAGIVLGLGGLVLIWRPLLAATVNTELAEAEGLKPEQSQFLFMILMAGIVAISMKIIGILLITSLLIIPAATARQLASSPEHMAIIAALLGAGAVTGGLTGAHHLGSPSGPSVVVAAVGLFLIIFLISLVRDRRKTASGHPS